jgi:hypothetical protein
MGRKMRFFFFITRHLFFLLLFRSCSQLLRACPMWQNDCHRMYYRMTTGRLEAIIDGKRMLGMWNTRFSEGFGITSPTEMNEHAELTPWSTLLMGNTRGIYKIEHCM